MRMALRHESANSKVPGKRRCFGKENGHHNKNKINTNMFRSSEAELQPCAVESSVQHNDENPDTVEWKQYLSCISNARTTQALLQSLLSMRDFLEQWNGQQSENDISQQCKSIDNTKKGNVRIAVERLLTWQLSTVSRQMEEQSSTRNYISTLSSIITTLLECLCLLWNVDVVTVNYQDVSSSLVRAWRVELVRFKSQWISLQEMGDIKAKKDMYVNQQTTLIMLVRTMSLLVKQYREKQYDTIRSDGIVEMLVQTSKLVNIHPLNVNCQQVQDEEMTTANSSMNVILQGEILMLTHHLSHRASAQDQLILYDQTMQDVVVISCHPEHELKLLETVTGILWSWTTYHESCRKMCVDTTLWIRLRILWHRMAEKCSIENLALRLNIIAIVGTMIASCTTVGSDTAFSNCTEQPFATVIQEQEWIVPSLFTVLNDVDVDADYRRRCMRTVRCLSTCEWGRDMLWYYPQIEATLLKVLRMENIANDTRMFACLSVSTLLPNIPSMRSSSILLGPFLDTALIEIVERVGRADATEDQNIDKLVLAACQALCKSLQYSPWQRSEACFTRHFFAQISVVLQSNIDKSTFHQAVSELFVQLVRREETLTMDDVTMKATLIRDITKRLVSVTSVLEILTMLLTPIYHPDFEVSRENAINVLGIIVEDNESNKKPLAQDEFLLTALVNLCLMNNNDFSVIKDKAKQLILKLVPEL